MFFRELFEELQKRTLEIDCPLMTLHRTMQGELCDFSGRGYIKQTHEDKFQFKIFLDEIPQEKIFETSSKIGDAVPKCELFSLTATDFQEQKWESERVTPTRLHGGVITGEIDEVTRTRKLEDRLDNAFMLVGIVGDIIIPANQNTHFTTFVGEEKREESLAFNVWEIVIDDFRIELAKKDGAVTIRVHSKSENFPPKTGNRIMEALQFVLGHPLDRMIMEKRQGNIETLEIRSPDSESSFEPSCLPPLRPLLGDTDPARPLLGHYDPEPASKLFEKYFSYTMKDQTNYRHPLSQEIRCVHRARKATLNDHSLVLGVAVECVLNLCFPRGAKATKELKDNIVNLCDYVERWDGDEGFKERALGAIKAIVHPRPQDKLEHLLEQGVLRRTHIDAWKKLRQKAVHPSRPLDFPPNEWLRINSSVYSLFLCLIFAAIGYEGKYTEYGVPGWPEKVFPDNFNSNS